MAMMSPMTAAYGMPQMMPGMMQQQMMPQQMLPQQQLMPGMMPQQMMGGMSPYGGMYGQQPVYFNSMSQLPPGAVPVSQNMLAQALGQAPAEVEQPSTIGRILKGAGIGAAAGAAFGLIPFLPLGMFSGAIVGAGVGAVLALLKKPKQPEGEFHTMTPEQQQAQAQAQMIASTPPGARSASMTSADGSTNSSGQRQPVVMGPEMRKKWAAKVRAEKAAEATAAKTTAKH